MPPKKAQEKKDAPPKAKGDEAIEMILDYLRNQNRPYSATDISANLHNAITKTNAAKILKDLSDSGDLIVCVAGKQMVYHTPQDPDDFGSPEEIASMNSEIEDLKERSITLKSKLKNLQLTLQQLRSMPTADDLESMSNALNDEVSELQSRLTPLKQGNVKPISPEEKSQVYEDYRKMQGLMNTRKKYFINFWNSILDGLGDGNPNDLKLEHGKFDEVARLMHSTVLLLKDLRKSIRKPQIRKYINQNRIPHRWCMKLEYVHVV